MKCLNDAIIRAFLDEELAEKKKRRVEAHLQKCQACRARLQETRKRILHIRSCLARLEPETVPIPPEMVIATQKWDTLIKQWLLVSVRVPAGILVLFVILSLTLSMVLFAKIKKEPEASSGIIYFFSEKRMKSIRVDHNIKDLQPIKNPRVFLLRESEK